MNVNRKLAAGVIVLFSVVVWAWFQNQMNHWFTVRWLAFQAKRSVNPVELQQWATNLLANHGDRLGRYQDFYGTNMPSSLKKVMPGHPNVQINNPDEVWVCGESKSGPFLVVGAPSLATPTQQHKLDGRGADLRGRTDPATTPRRIRKNLLGALSPLRC